MTPQALCERIDALLPQTQCTRCDYPDCRAYAAAISQGKAPINQCPPGGARTIAALAQLTGSPILALDAARGTMPLVPEVALIAPDDCIGCFKCIRVCPVDAIIGAPKFMHTILAADCSGCELCVPVCPTDCITMVPREAERSAGAALEDHWRRRHRAREARLAQTRAARDEARRQRRGAALTERAAAFDIGDAIERSRRRRGRSNPGTRV